ncbi:MAG TPA: hypothetical protein EYH35_05350, partial [Thiotrichaceae bacterium]|nr:hypothetical protein [Thiotrichaceae bacterium]
MNNINNLIFKLGVLAIYISMVILFMVVMKYVPFCPESFLNHIGDMLFCSCYLWNVITFELIIFISIVSIWYWEKLNKVDYPLAIFPSTIFSIVGAFSESASAINGWSCAIGPDTTISTSIYILPMVIVVSTLIYFGLIIIIFKRLENKSSRKKYWSTFLFAVLIYTIMAASLAFEL